MISKFLVTLKVPAKTDPAAAAKLICIDETHGLRLLECEPYVPTALPAGVTRFVAQMHDAVGGDYEAEIFATDAAAAEREVGRRGLRGRLETVLPA